MLIGVLAAIGAVITAFACARVLLALRRGQPREVVIGWFGVMLAAPIIVLLVDRLTTPA